MSRRHEAVDGNEEVENDEFTESEDDDGLDEDMEALRRACMITGASVDGLAEKDGGGECRPESTVLTPKDDEEDGLALVKLDSDNEDDVQLLRKIRNRFAVTDANETGSMKSLRTLTSVAFSDDDEEDDFETLRAIQKRFSAYENAETLESTTNDALQNQLKVHPFGIASDNETSTQILNRSNTCEGFPDSQITVPAPISDSINSYDKFENTLNQPVDIIDTSEQDLCKTSVTSVGHSSFPESARAFVDAIKRNRSYQKFLRSKLIHIESRIEKGKKLAARVKILRDFQVSCKKITGRALSQKKDPRVELILARKCMAQDNAEESDKKNGPMQHGPCENCHVPKYQMVLANFPLSVERNNWSGEETENLAKGIIQQLQEMMLHVSVDRYGRSHEGKNDLDFILESIKGLEVTPDMIRQFLPKVNWDQIASTYLKGRTGAECETRWLNWEDPLINHGPWTAEEENNLLAILQEKGIKDWFHIAVSLGTNRTPFQCLARYQRSLNPSIINKDWSREEDDQLRLAVELYGEHDWQSVASMLTGRTGTQCSNRWKKSLHPVIQTKGRWTDDEDKRLKVAVMLFGAANWNKIAQFVPGRIQTQCRERWKNVLDPSINHGYWTRDEDGRLIDAVAKHGHRWSKVAACVPARTDNQCWRRWKALFPEEVPLIREARRWKWEKTIRNFVDRETERPAFQPTQLTITSSVTETPPLKIPRKRRSKSRKRTGMNSCCNEREGFSQPSSGLSNGQEIIAYDSNMASRIQAVENYSDGEHDTGPVRAASQLVPKSLGLPRHSEADTRNFSECSALEQDESYTSDIVRCMEETPRGKKKRRRRKSAVDEELPSWNMNSKSKILSADALHPASVCGKGMLKHERVRKKAAEGKSKKTAERMCMDNSDVADNSNHSQNVEASAERMCMDNSDVADNSNHSQNVEASTSNIEKSDSGDWDVTLASFILVTLKEKYSNLLHKPSGK